MTPEEAEQKAREIANAPSWDDGMSFSKIDLENLIYDALVGSSCQWQPIETAPRDGSEVLVCRAATKHFGSYCVVAAWWGNTKGWCVDDPMYPLHFEPTHWMPLPAPPKT